MGSSCQLPEQRQAKLNAFYEEYKANPLALIQWFADQALADRSDVLDQVKLLLKHEAYHPKNPNDVRSLVGAFASNTIPFSITKRVPVIASQWPIRSLRLIKFNPMLAASLTKGLATPHRYNKGRQEHIKEQLERLRDQVKSNNVKEIVSKSLAILATKAK